ncbi:M23 family metallopeptidase [Embleya scabrispora]|uniref:M23 family metallopeptidase n=1 Tax=Embleya scabrispora TaxID=159449 RepID=UPI00131A115A|nr:M23 family metallopeptidase [Embleya scabrispora]MYS81932.1 peptidoglycan DD-metalloendopeptidase family protein [Streptomyces sp. SID5474]
MRRIRTRRLGLPVLVVITLAAVGFVPARADGDDGDAPARKQRADVAAEDMRADLDASPARLASAETAYAEAEAAGPGARAALDAARARVAEAQARTADLGHDVELADAAVRTATSELHDVVASTQAVRDDVTRLVGRAYRNGGMAQLSMILRAQTPAELLSSLQGYREMLQADHETIARLERTRDAIDLRRAELERRREEARVRHAQAGRQLAEVVALEKTAADAAAKVAALAAQREAALRIARQEKAADQQRYEAIRIEQKRLTELVNRRNAAGGAGRPGVSTQGGALSYPVPGSVNSGFGMRYHPILEYTKLHTGIDFAVPEGTSVAAAREGTVVQTGYNAAYGYRVVLSHGHVGGVALTTTYNHLSRITVREGQRVSRGGRVGRSGRTGWSTGAHLHFEVLVDGDFVDPTLWM